MRGGGGGVRKVNNRTDPKLEVANSKSEFVFGTTWVEDLQEEDVAFMDNASKGWVNAIVIYSKYKAHIKVED